VWLFSVWKWAKCPRCLNLNLTDWPKRHYHNRLWVQILTALGAHKHRCFRCRHNFVSFRPRAPEFNVDPEELDDLNLNEEEAVPGAGEEAASEPSPPGRS
jgi:hypothetical protein